MDEFLHVGGILRECRHPDRYGDIGFFPSEDNRLIRDFFPDFFSQFDSPLFGAVRQKHGKFLPPIAAYQIAGFFEKITEHHADRTQDNIPGRVAEAIVVLFEFVQIEHQEG